LKQDRKGEKWTKVSPTHRKAKERPDPSKRIDNTRKVKEMEERHKLAKGRDVILHNGAAEGKEPEGSL